MAMTKGGVLRVTLDTNICNLIADPVQYAKLAPPGTGTGLQAAIAEGRIRGFASEASVFGREIGTVLFSKTGHWELGKNRTVPFTCTKKGWQVHQDIGEEKTL